MDRKMIWSRITKWNIVTEETIGRSKKRGYGCSWIVNRGIEEKTRW